MRSLTVRQRIVTVLHMTWAGRGGDKQRKMIQACARVMKDMITELEVKLEAAVLTGLLQ